MRPKKPRLSGNVILAISGTKSSLGLTYKTIGLWMGLSASNISAMISLGLNPTKDEWLKFKDGLRAYINGMREPVYAPADRLTPCGCPCGCRGHFIKTGGNNYRCFACVDNCKRRKSND